MKITRIAAITLAVHLFELEVDTISQEPEFHFEFNGWLDKYGELSLKHEPALTSDKENEFNAIAIEELATEIQKDFATGHWTIGSCDSGLYNYMMPTQYGGTIANAFDKQLAMLTGVGYQTELFA